MYLIYIAGPYSAPSNELIEANIVAAEKFAAPLIETELCSVLIPHSIGRNYKDGPGSSAYWYAATLEMCRRCDALLLMPKSSASVDSMVEVDTMKELQRPVFRNVNECIDWLRCRND